MCVVGFASLLAVVLTVIICCAKCCVRGRRKRAREAEARDVEAAAVAQRGMETVAIELVQPGAAMRKDISSDNNKMEEAAPSTASLYVPRAKRGLWAQKRFVVRDGEGGDKVWTGEVRRHGWSLLVRDCRGAINSQ